MGNSGSGEVCFEQDSDDLSAKLEQITEDGLPLNEKAQKALLEIRKIMENKQPIQQWRGQLVQFSDRMEQRRDEAIRDPDFQHASRLQRKLRSSPREKIGRRSASAPERLMTLSRREYIDGMNLQLSRTQSILEIELSHWFGLRVDDLVHRTYLKYLAVNPLLDEFLDSDDEEYDHYQEEAEGEEEEEDHDSSCECECHHHSYEEASDVPDQAKEKFIEETVSHVLEFKKLLGDKAMNSRKKSERNAHAAKINDKVRSFIQHTTSHFFKKFDMKKKTVVPEKLVTKQKPVPMSREERLLALKKKIIPYRGRTSSRDFFNEFFDDFLKTHDDCDCEFVKQRRCVSEDVSIMEIAVHVQHHLQSVHKVKELFLELLRGSPNEIKDCPIEMQLMYQCFANNLLDDEAMEGVIDFDKDSFEVTKDPSGLFEKITATFEAPGLNIDDETFGYLPKEVQKAMEGMIQGSKKVGKVVVRQSITVNRQSMKKLTKK